MIGFNGGEFTHDVLRGKRRHDVSGYYINGIGHLYRPGEVGRTEFEIICMIL